MRPNLFALCLLSLVACKKDKPVVATAAPSNCTPALLNVADPERCETACFGGDAVACDVASSQFHRGLMTRRDPGRALSLAAKGCDLGSAGACANVASVLSGQYDGQWPDGGVYADEAQRAVYREKAFVAAERECAAGLFESCSMAAYWAVRSTGSSRAPDEAKAKALAQRAVMLMEKACAEKNGFACADWATSLSVGGLDLERDEAKAQDLYAKACAYGQADACRQAVPPKAEDDVRGPLLARGCELGAGDACFLWSIQLTGDEAQKALKRGCELRDGLACHTLARQEKGEEAARLLTRACAVGYEGACQP